jgi:hypothetical protein
MVAGGCSTAPKIGFTAAEAEVINAEIEAAKAQNPADILHALREQRKEIVLTININEERAQDSWNREFDLTDGATSPEAAARPYREKAAAARQQLKAFDAEHPEVLAAIQAQKAKEMKSFLASD